RRIKVEIKRLSTARAPIPKPPSG
ncbi:hypothetical protein THAOC_05325, partial [Thalassiosira oceanica]